MTTDWLQLLAPGAVEATAPCRVDLGGTLDLATIGMALAHLSPCTVNIALTTRTRVVLTAGARGWIRVSSEGFQPARFRPRAAPCDHPLGLIFAVADYFNADGIDIHIASGSPPRSALGGSSVAAVALVAAFSRVLSRAGARPLNRRQVALLAHRIEAAAAGGACGLQDQLAAAYGGINAWYWSYAVPGAPFRRRRLAMPEGIEAFNRCLLVAYGGKPHVSQDVNSRWVRDFRRGGRYRRPWERIAALSHAFVAALNHGDLTAAAAVMNAETALRQEMTPRVLDAGGRRLVAAAMDEGCGARFAGAGGGGCIWALGPVQAVAGLRKTWQSVLATIPEATLLDAGVDCRGVTVSRSPTEGRKSRR